MILSRRCDRIALGLTRSSAPSVSAHRELGAIVAAGLPPYLALKSGTANVGVYFGTQSTVGTVAAISEPI